MIKLCVYIFIGFENKQKFKTKILRLARVGISPHQKNSVDYNMIWLFFITQKANSCYETHIQKSMKSQSITDSIILQGTRKLFNIFVFFCKLSVVCQIYEADVMIKYSLFRTIIFGILCLQQLCYVFGKIIILLEFTHYARFALSFALLWYFFNEILAINGGI